MSSLCDIATFLLSALDAKDTNNLALVNSEIFYGPPTSYISRSIHNRIPSKRNRGEPSLRDFIEKLKIIKPNLHLLTLSLQDMDVNNLTLQWKYPFVRATTNAPHLDLKSLTPNLAYFTVQEEGHADHCLDLFNGLTIPSRLKLLDLRQVHIPRLAGHDKFANVVNCAKGVKTIFCSCCNIFTRSVWETKWTEVPCSFITFPEQSICENS
jgi:hypothetical protein